MLRGLVRKVLISLETEDAIKLDRSVESYVF
jgi:hypothetical protein